MGLVRVPLIAVTVALAGTMLPFGSVCQASNDIKLWLAPGSTSDSKPNVASSVILSVKGILAGSICGSPSPKSWPSKVPLYKVILLDFSFISRSLASLRARC